MNELLRSLHNAPLGRSTQLRVKRSKLQKRLLDAYGRESAERLSANLAASGRSQSDHDFLARVDRRFAYELAAHLIDEMLEDE